MTTNFPRDFLFGAATAATQVEGGDKGNIWYAWAQKEGRIKNGGSPLRGTDHWTRWREDFDLMMGMGLTTYRFGLEWSRIEPQPGVFDGEAIAQYREMLEYLIERNIKPLVTLFHFSLPRWFKGGFEQPESAAIFERYVRYAADKLGDLVEDWITINEPNVYAVNGYYFGTFPPGKKSFPLAMLVFKHMAIAHIRAYNAIHEICPNARVGVAHHLRVFSPLNKMNPADIAAAKLMKYLFQDAIIECMATGNLVSPIGHNAPFGKGNYQDFFGVNYYSRSAIQAKGFTETTFPNVPVSELGWEIYPKGLYKLCKEIYKKYNVSIYITENGICDGKDEQRSQFIVDHLYEVSKLINDGVDVSRYYHWTLTDNFEWLEGETARFGLASVDFETQKRMLRPSGWLYSLIAKTHKLP